ncbi:MAG: hypothetical protein GWO04_14625, partial [Actinobacteria bacterium]|nr:hypothetical protein [Actinomycetota bacterium]
RSLNENEIDDPARLSGPLTALSEAVIEASTADPAAGTPALADGMRRVRLCLRGELDDGSPVDVVETAEA